MQDGGVSTMRLLEKLWRVCPKASLLQQDLPSGLAATKWMKISRRNLRKNLGTNRLCGAPVQNRILIYAPWRSVSYKMRKSRIWRSATCALFAILIYVFPIA